MNSLGAITLPFQFTKDQILAGSQCLALRMKNIPSTKLPFATIYSGIPIYMSFPIGSPLLPATITVKSIAISKGPPTLFQPIHQKAWRASRGSSWISGIPSIKLPCGWIPAGASLSSRTPATRRGAGSALQGVGNARWEE